VLPLAALVDDRLALAATTFDAVCNSCRLRHDPHARRPHPPRLDYRLSLDVNRRLTAR
jgi:hypothetical protein